MNLNDAFPSASFKAADFDGGQEVTLTISKVELREIGQGTDKQTKPVLSFADSDKTLVLNKINGNTIASMYGDKNIDRTWIGKRITLRSEMTTMQGKAMPGVRVKLMDEKETAKAAFWEKADGMGLSPKEARAILAESGGDFKVAASKLDGSAIDDFPPLNTPTGNITPKMLIDSGLASDIATAAKVVNELGVAGKPAAELWPRVKLYYQWITAGYDHDSAAGAAISGELLK